MRSGSDLNTLKMKYTLSKAKCLTNYFLQEDNSGGIFQELNLMRDENTNFGM